MSIFISCLCSKYLYWRVFVFHKKNVMSRLLDDSRAFLSRSKRQNINNKKLQMSVFISCLHSKYLSWRVFVFLKKKCDEQILRWFWGFLKSQLKTKYKKKLQMSVFISCLYSQYLYWRVFFSLKKVMSRFLDDSEAF